MRTMWDGKGKIENNHNHEIGPYMPDLRKAVLIMKQKLLEYIRMIGNASGCHQMPERSFFYKGKQFPVCARCTGVTVGQFLAVLINIIGFCVRSRSNSGQFMEYSINRKKDIIPASISVISLGMMGADWAIQEAGIKESTNLRRFITGILGGFGLFNLYFIAFRRLYHFVKRHI